MTQLFSIFKNLKNIYVVAYYSIYILVVDRNFYY